MTDWLVALQTGVDVVPGLCGSACCRGLLGYGHLRPVGHGSEQIRLLNVGLQIIDNKKKYDNFFIMELF